MSAWRNAKTQPEQACPLDAVDPHATVEMKRVAPDVITTVEQGPQSFAGSNPAALTTHQFMSIPFTQFLMPDGRQTQVEIDRPPEVEADAQRLLEIGCVFEIEMLTTGQISMEVVRGASSMAGAICSNGPEVPLNVDGMIQKAIYAAKPYLKPHHTMSTGRPAGGYKNAAGKRVPGVTTILGRFKDSGGLIQWAWTVGRDGKDLNEVRDAAADAGTICHDMIDCHLHGRQYDASKDDKAVLEKAEHAFLGYLEWKERMKLTLVAAEVSLVSEKHQFGGTFDCALTGGDASTLSILDYKTSSGVYTDMLIQVAGGYTLLWQEHHPDQPLGGVHILRVTKPRPPEDDVNAPEDPVSFHHHYWSAEVIPIAQEQFLLFRRAYDLDARLKKMV